MDFRVLGPVGVMNGSEDVSIGGGRQRRLLAALVIDDGRVASVDRLVEAVWGDEAEPPEGAARTVLSYVSRLRSALGEGRILTEGAGYRLARGGCGLDASRFVDLVAEAHTAPPSRALGLLNEALALWRGRAFGEFADEWWARPSAIRLEELRLVALEERAQTRLDLGAHAEAVAELDELVTAHPLRERFRLQLMMALYRSGRQAEALRSYHDYRSYLADETGLEPSRELVELERRIALADPSLAFVTAGRTTRGYVLADVIGEGAFGVVYRAVQPSVGREVAVKVVKAELADDPAYILRFEAEARMIARLEHPHVVPLYDFWREPGGAYLVFRYLRGGTGATRGGAWPIARVDRLVGEIGSALVAAHDAGIVHRDVKPANLLFDEGGSAYLADFGIALDAPVQNAVAALRSAGSPLYASPEQVRDGFADARSDQYGFGIVLWEFLAGTVPFDDHSVTGLFRAKLERPVPSLGALRPDVPEAIDALLQRATAVHPDDRFPSVADFLMAWAEAFQRPALATVTTGELQSSVPSGSSATMAQLRVAVNPYKGLRAFDEADTADFFGRDDDIDALASLVAEHRFVAVVGPSGSGKSSLVRAGLVSRLRSAGALVVVTVPGSRPLDELADALLQVAVRSPGQLRDHLARPGRFAAAVDELLPEGRGDLVVVIDQFEELWTLSDRDERGLLLDGLADAVAGEGRLRVVATLRADFYDRPLTHPTIGPLVRDATFAVTPLAPGELEQAIRAPASRVGVRLESGLVADLVADCATHPAALPLLQYTLTEVFDQRSGATMTDAAYASLGGLAGAIASRAEAVYNGLDDADKAASRRLFTRLVTAGEGGEDTRRRTRRSELAAVPDAVIDAFGTARLLTFDVEPSDRAPTIEVAHEALIRQWPRLRGWLDDDRDGLRTHRHLTESAAAWTAAGSEPGDLYRGARLATATDWAAHHGDDLNPTESAFLRMSTTRARRARRRARGAVGALAVLVVIAVITAVVATSQRRRADRNATQARASQELADQNATKASASQLQALSDATAAQQSAQAATASAQKATAAGQAATDAATASDQRRLAFEAQTVAAQQPQLALLLAEEAYRRNPDADSQGALLTALDSLRDVSRYVTVADQPVLRSAAASEDGRVVVVRTATKAIIVDGDTLEPTGVTIPADTNTTVKLSPDGTELATATNAGVIRRYSPTTGNEVAPQLTVSPGNSGLTDQRYGVPIAYVQNGRLAAADGNSTNLVVVAPGSVTVEQRYTLPSGIFLLDASSSGRYLFVFQSGRNGRGYILDDATGSLRELPAPFADVGFDEARNRIFGAEQSLPLTFDEIDLASMKAVKQIQNSTNLSFEDWTVLADGSSFALGSDTRTLYHFDANFQELPSLADPRLGQAISLANGHVASPIGDGIGLLDLSGRGALAKPLEVDSGRVSGNVAVSGDGRRMAVASGDVRIYDVATMSLVGGPYPLPQQLNLCGIDAPTVPCAETGGSSPYTVPQLSYDGQILVYWGYSTRVTVVDTVAGTTHLEPGTEVFPSAQNPYGEIPNAMGGSVSPDGRYLALATHSEFKILDLTTGQWTATIPVASETGGISTWDSTSARVVYTPDDVPGIVVDRATGAHRSFGRVVGGAAWSPDGSQLALGGANNEDLSIIDSATGQVVKVLSGLSLAHGLTYTPDSKRLVQIGVGAPLTLQLIDLTTGGIIGHPIKLGGADVENLQAGIPHPLAYSPDLKTEYVGSLGTIWVYDLDPASWAVKACEDAGRNLTQEEWKTYIGALVAPYRPTCSQYPAGS